jgi:hypothetical protein
MSEIVGLVSFAVLIVLLVSRVIREQHGARNRVRNRQSTTGSLPSKATTEQEDSLIRN